MSTAKVRLRVAGLHPTVVDARADGTTVGRKTDVWLRARADLAAIPVVESDLLLQELHDPELATWIFGLDQPPASRLAVAIARAWKVAWEQAKVTDQWLSTRLAGHADKLEAVLVAIREDVAEQPFGAGDGAVIDCSKVEAFICSLRAQAADLDADHTRSLQPPASHFDHDSQQKQMERFRQWQETSVSAHAATSVFMVRLLEVYALNTGRDIPFYHNNSGGRSGSADTVDNRLADYLTAAGRLCGYALPETKGVPSEDYSRASA